MMPRRGIIRRAWLLRCLVLALTMVFLTPSKEAEAHPLGNFTINHYSRLEFTDGAAHITYILDLAEIPAFQQRGLLDTSEDGNLSDTEAATYLDRELPGLLEGLQLTVGDEVLPLRVLDRSAVYRPGQGGLPTLRIEARLLADLPDNWEEHGAARYIDRNYQDRPGWREIVVQGGPEVAVEGSTAPSIDVSNELRSYPQDSLSSPLNHREARFALVPSNETAAANTVDQTTKNAGMSDNGDATGRLASLVSVDRPSATAIAISLLAAFLWGAAHALTPGHGKAVVAAYLIGAQGTPRHAGFLGLTVTLSHTAGVFALGVVTLYLSRYFLPEVLYPWLNVVSGSLVVAIGLTLLCRRLVKDGNGHAEHGASADSAHSHGGSGHPCTHVHSSHVPSHRDRRPHCGHEHTHSHGYLLPGTDESKVTWRSLLALGVSGGLVPCPAALVLLLSAISLGRLGLGMVLVVGFSAGLAIVLTGIGILMIYARRLFERFSFEARTPRLLPVASAVAISIVGLVIVLRSLKQTGII
jgi:nickel/cobalt transporter (NicO) family protein